VRETGKSIYERIHFYKKLGKSLSNQPRRLYILMHHLLKVKKCDIL
jgi:hypothetical protein